MKVTTTIVKHRTMLLDGVNIFYREAGSANAPVVLLPHGYPCSSFQFRNFIPALADRWLRAVAHHRVTVLSGWPDESVEDLFATPVQNAKQVQRLIDGGGDVLILTDAHRTRVGLEKDGSYD